MHANRRIYACAVRAAGTHAVGFILQVRPEDVPVARGVAKGGGENGPRAVHSVSSESVL